MKRGSVSVLRWISLLFIFAAILLIVVELISYSRIRNTYPGGMVIAGVPVGGLDEQQAADRLVQSYGVPIELHYNGAVIQIKPNVLGFELDLQSMLSAADLQRINQPFWTAFWDFLWNRLPQPSGVPLIAKVSEDRLRSYLQEEVASRYDTPPSSPVPVPGTVNFQPGAPGSTLDIDRSVGLIEDALRSSSSRVVNLTFNNVKAPRPSMQNLEILIKQAIDASGYDGLTEMYLLDLQTNEDIDFAYQLGQDVSPGISFTAASTMKIPIMVSIFRRTVEPTPEDITQELELMIEVSENDPADRLIQKVIDRNLGPLSVTEDMRILGLQNTYWAGYFFVGAPLLQRFETPGNTRTDVNTSPDSYNQTSPSEMGMLLDDIYQCAELNGGALLAAFGGEVSQNECQQMIAFLTKNDMPVMIQGGVSETTRVAHKHGWINDNDGLMHNMSDIGIVYSPGGNYILCMFFNHSNQLLFDQTNDLGITLSRAVFNYFNQVQ